MTQERFEGDQNQNFEERKRKASILRSSMEAEGYSPVNWMENLEPLPEEDSQRVDGVIKKAVDEMRRRRNNQTEF